MAYKRNLAFPLAPTVSDPGDKKKKKKKQPKGATKRAIDREDKRIRKRKISKQLADKGSYSVDVSGERKVKKKVAKIQKKIDAVTDKKDARQKKLVKSGVRRETRKNQLLQKQVEAERVESGKQSQIKEEKDRIKKRIEKRAEKKKGKKDSGNLPEGKYKPIRRLFQKGRKYNKAIRKGTGIGVKNKTTRKKRM